MAGDGRARWPLRRRRDSSWTERARFAWPSRRLGPAATAILWGVTIVAFLSSRPDHPLLPTVVLLILAIACGLMGIIQSMIANERRVNPAFSLTPRATRGAWIFRLGIWGPILLLAIVGAALVPDRLNLTAVIELALIALGMGVYLGWGWAALMRLLGVFRPASERLRTIVSNLSEQSGITGPRRIEQVSLPMANAFALPLDGSLAMTDAALAVLADDEVRVICGRGCASWGAAPIRLDQGLTGLLSWPLPGADHGRKPAAPGQFWASRCTLGIRRGFPGSLFERDPAQSPQSKAGASPIRRRSDGKPRRDSTPGRSRQSTRRTCFPRSCDQNE